MSIETEFNGDYAVIVLGRTFLLTEQRRGHAESCRVASAWEMPQKWLPLCL